jgi:hypothetical protein
MHVLLSFGAVQSTKEPPAVLDPGRQYLDNGTVLESRGLLKEAEAQYSSAMMSRDPAVQQMAQAGLARTHALQELNLVQTDLHLGRAFEDAHQFDRALAAYERAFREGKDEQREAARLSVLRVLQARESFYERYLRGWVHPWLTKFSLSVLGLVVLYVLLKLLYGALKGVGSWIGSRSNRIEISDFEDSTDTGLGKGFPAVLRTVYRDRQMLAESTSTSRGGLALAFRSSQSGPQPVMGSATYETFSEFKLDLAGVEVSELLHKIERIVCKPHYQVGGVIYRQGDIMRAAVSLSRYNTKEVMRWDFAVTAQQGGLTTLTDPMYEIIDAILRDWNA